MPADTQAPYAGFHKSLADLTPDPRNANRGTDRGQEMIANSLRKYGAGRSILLDKHGAIIAGNKTFENAGTLGMDDVIVVPTDGTKLVAVQRMDLDLADPKTREMAIADNRAGQVSLDWDIDALKELATEIDLAPFWSVDELEAMWPHNADLLTDEDAVPDLPEEAVTKPGDLYIMGRHRLLCGDCRDSASVARLMDGAKINVAITSPPYASQREYDESSGFKPIPPDEYVEWYRDVAANIMAHLAEDGSYFCNIKEHCEDGQRSLYVKDLTLAHVREWGWRFVDEFCWVRSGVPGKWPNRFKNGFEPVFHFCQNEKIKFYGDAVGHESDYLLRYSPSNPKTHSGFLSSGGGGNGGIHGIALPNNVLDISTARADKERGHTAEFPVALPEFFIKAFSDQNDAIFDPFMGSGTTLIAAEKTGTSAYGTELSPAYCDVIVKRWQDATGQKAVLDGAAA